MNKEEFLENSCAVPFLVMSTFSNGNFHPCCWIDEPYKKDNGETFNFNVDTPEAALGSQDAARWRTIFLTKGAVHPTCNNVCRSAEKAGGVSKRQALLKYMFKDDSIIDDILEGRITYPKLIEVKLTNLCNLRCKTCIPEHSSSIMSQFKPESPRDQKRIIEIKKAYDMYLDSRGGLFLDSIIRNIEVVEWLEFYGGEPFMIKDHKKFLQQIVDSGYAKNITLSYTTNGTKYDDAYINLFKEFKGVVISLSIDAVGKLNDEIRIGSDWNVVNQNFYNYKALYEAGIITGLNVNTTVSIYNAHAIFDLIEYFAPTKCTLSLSILEHPQEMSIVNLSFLDKASWIKKYTEYLTKYSIHNEFVPQLNMIKGKLL